MKNSWISSSILAKAKLQAIWQEVEEPLVVLFTNSKVPYCLQAQSRLFDFQQTVNNFRVIEFLIEDREDEEASMMEYGVTSYPTALIYDYGKELKRLNRIQDFQPLTLQLFVQDLA